MRSLEQSINERLKTQFEVNLFKASLNTLKHTDDPIRFNSFATSFRELTRHVLNRLAPDEKIIKCQWYANETDKKNGVTRKQRMLYAIKGGLSDQFVINELEFDINGVSQELKKIIDNLSKYTHIEEDTFEINTQLGDELTNNTLIAMDNFLKTIEKFRKEITIAYEERLFELIDDVITTETFTEIDELATHYWVKGVWINRISIDSIDEEEISVTVNGSVDVGLQYGSDSDYKHGDGVRTSDSYPFTVSLSIDVKSPLDLSVVPRDIEIDNSKFYQ